jgi:hypothetical protein
MARTRNSMKRYGNYRKSLQKYDSKFELKLHEEVLSVCEFHPEEKIEYTISHKYSPDFRYEKDGVIYLIESKGRFAESNEVLPHTRAGLSRTVFEHLTKRLSKRSCRVKMVLF